ncbi:MAG: DUF1232 domain-containing protein [Anaerolineae bacterium]|nr:DUF1232 domain-containing protein [Anaerolineae bacterium]
MAELEDFDNIDEPVEGEVIPEDHPEQPGWGKALAWGTIVLGGLYIINPTAGIFELIPDVVPIVGNLDEAALMFLIFGAMRYLGWTLPEFIERWTLPRPQLPAPRREE